MYGSSIEFGRAEQDRAAAADEIGHHGIDVEPALSTSTLRGVGSKSNRHLAPVTSARARMALQAGLPPESAAMLRPRYRSGRSATAGVTPATDLRSAVWSMSPRRLTSPITWQRNVGERRQIAEQPFRLAILRHQHGSLGAGVAGARTGSGTWPPSIAIVLAPRGREDRPRCGTAQTGLGPSSPATPRHSAGAPAKNSRGPAPGPAKFIDAQAHAAASSDRRSATGECLDR